MVTLGAPTPASNEQALANDLRSLGLSPAGVAAFLGNFQTESGFSNTSYNPAENAHGFANWEGGRWTALQAYAQRNHLNPTSSQAEIGYLNQELTGPYAGVLAAVKSAGNNVSAAAQIVQARFEGSTPDSLGARQANANSIYAQLLHGVPLTGGGAANTGGAVQGGGSSAGLLGQSGGDIAPGGSWDPLNWPGEILSTGASDIASGVESIIVALAHPLYTFLLNATLVIVGIVVLIIGIVILSKSGDDVTTDDADDETRADEQSSSGKEAEAAAVAE